MPVRTRWVMVSMLRWMAISAVLSQLCADEARRPRLRWLHRNSHRPDRPLAAMTWLLLISSSLDAVMGIALLLLWRLDRRYAQIRQWGWSWILLAAGLALVIALAAPAQGGWRHDLQALVASSCLMGSLG